MKKHRKPRVVVVASTNNDHARVLDHLGGAHNVARALGVTHHVTLKWRQRGIPSVYWHRIARLNPIFSAAYLAATKPPPPGPPVRPGLRSKRRDAEARL